VHLVRRPEAEIELDTACLLIAARARPEVDPLTVVADGRAALDRLAAGCPAPTVEALRTHLFATVGFTGNRHHYDDARNSYLDQVLARRTGIPITLAVVVLEVGRRLGLDLRGVGMPGHFLVGVGEGVYLDAFDNGRLLDEAACRRVLRDVLGANAPWDPALLAPVGPLAIVGRVLANLRNAFETTQDLVGLDWVIELRLALPDTPDTEHGLRASVLSSLGRYGEAASELEELAAVSDSEVAEELRNRAARLRAHLN